MITCILIISILLLIFIVLTINLYIKLAKIKNKKESNELLQDMFYIMGEKSSTDNKITNLSNAINEVYKPKYLSIVLYDGNKNNVSISNVDKMYFDSIINIAKDNIFNGNISRNIAKYITTNGKDTLLYESAIERKIKSALLIPIYHNKSYLGYILLEDDNANKFEDIDKSEIDMLRKNIGIFLENINYQSTMEKAESIDKQTGFFNNMYLYTNARNILNEYDVSSIALVYLKGLPDINEMYNRNIANSLLVKFANITKRLCPEGTIFIRYSGLRFLVLMPGYTTEKSHLILEKLLTRYKLENEFYEDEKVTLDTKIILHEFKKQNNVELEVQKMSSMFERIKDVNVIKII